MSARGRARVAWTVVALAFTWISLSALWPHDDPPQPPHGYTDKIQHAVAWLGLALVLLVALRVTRPPLDRARYTLAWSLLVVYGALVEALQMLVPGRSAEWLDLAADALGAAVGCAVMLGLERFHDRALGRTGRTARDDAALQGLGPGGRAADAHQQPRPRGR